MCDSDSESTKKRLTLFYSIYLFYTFFALKPSFPLYITCLRGIFLNNIHSNINSSIIFHKIFNRMDVTSDDYSTKQSLNNKDDLFLPTGTTSTQDALYRIAFLTAIAIFQLPFERIKEDLVPTVIFTRKPMLFQGFGVSLMFAFSGSMASESMNEKQPKMALLCHKLAMFAVAVAGGVFALSSLLSYYNIEMVPDVVQTPSLYD